MKSICFVVRGYPTKENSSFAFLQPLIHGIADTGFDCTVIAPQSINGKSKPTDYRPYKWEEKTNSGHQIIVYQPHYLSLPDVKFRGVQVNISGREKAVLSVLKKIKKPDVLYCHFWDCALLIGNYARKNEIPVVAVSGESKIDVNRYYCKEKIEKRLAAVKGLICVSTKNYNESNKLGLVKSNVATLISPNAIDTSMFYVTNKINIRKELNLPEDKFIISYVGRYSDRKGVNRVIDAAKAIPEIGLILIGYGGELHESDQILIAKRVAHEEVVKYLNASDAYCLPSLAEGCCNSIVEAMACGLPIISSDMEFNDDILDESNSIRIDPNNIKAIEEAFSKLIRDSALRNMLADNAKHTAEKLTMSNRVNTIVSFIQSVIQGR